MALAQSTTDPSACLAHRPTSLPMALSLATSHVSGISSTHRSSSRSRSAWSASSAAESSCLARLKSTLTLVALVSWSLWYASAHASFSAVLDGSSWQATCNTFSASAASPASIRRALSVERALTSASVGTRPIEAACSTLLACLWQRAAPSLSVQRTSLAAAACAAAQISSSSGSSCLRLSSSTAGTASGASSRPVVVGGPPGPPGSASPSLSSSSHSRSYMVPSASAAPSLAWSCHRRALSSCPSHASTRRQRLSAMALCLPPSISSSSSARCAS
mmetsp:Transcript_58830/g.157251  ORF Transcript_58830/g.157251 Transcript_58830/m.157251 type:complete len:276 (+) Transcript_58830:130-957(+)